MNEIFSQEIITEIIKLIMYILILIFSVLLINVTAVIGKKFNIELNTNDFKNVENLIRDVVFTCVQSTNQTFVNKLKKNGLFTKDKQQEAFNITYDAVCSIVENILKREIDEGYKTLIRNSIEEVVLSLKIPNENNENDENYSTVDLTKKDVTVDFRDSEEIESEGEIIYM